MEKKPKLKQGKTKYCKVARGGSCHWSERNRYQTRWHRSETEAGRYTTGETQHKQNRENIEIEKRKSEVRFEQNETTKNQEDVRIKLTEKEKKNEKVKENLESWLENLYSWQSSLASESGPLNFMKAVATVVSRLIWTNLVQSKNVILFFKIFLMAKLGLHGIIYWILKPLAPLKPG